MTCAETQTLVHGYLDGELDLLRSLEIEQHLEACPACAQAHASLQAIRAAVQNSSLYFQSPSGLAKNARSAIGSVTIKLYFAPP